MARPLTVADRAPQVGDILIPQEPSLYRVDDTRFGLSLKRVDSNGKTILEVTDWQYASRADGGPLTVEEDAAIHSPPPQP